MTVRRAFPPAFRQARPIAQGRRRRPARTILRAILGGSIPVLAAAVLLCAGSPVRAFPGLDRPNVSIAAQSGSYGFGIDDVFFTLRRVGSADNAISVRVSLSQDHLYLATDRLNAVVRFAAGEREAELQIRASRFNGPATQSGVLSATLVHALSYTVGHPDSARTRMVVKDPAIAVRPEQGAYIVDDDSETVRVTFVARTAPGLPRPNKAFSMAVSSKAASGETASRSKGAAVSQTLDFRPRDFAAEGGEWEARKNVSISMAEGDEGLELRYQRAASTPERIRPRNSDGSPCTDDVCMVPISMAVGVVPTLTIAAERDVYGYGIDNVAFVVTAAGPMDEAVDASVTLTQEDSYLAPGRLTQTVRIEPDETGARLVFLAGLQTGAVSSSGALTATIAPGDGYLVGTRASATTRIVVLDPAITVRPERASWRFTEGDAAATVVFVARTEPGLPRPGTALVISVSTVGRTDGATAPGDYAALSIELAIQPHDFIPDGGEWVARKEVMLSIVDDGEAEGDETFDLKLERSAGLPERVRFRQFDGSVCPETPCTVPVTIADPAPATGKPTISGVPQVGETLTADTGGIMDDDGVPGSADDFTYRWVRVDADGKSNPVDVGTDSSTYVPVTADVGKRIRVKVSFTDDGGNAEGPLEGDAYPAGTATIAARPEGPAATGLAITPVPPAASADHGPYYPKDDFLALPDDAVHGRGATLTFTLTLDAEVTVTGAPELVLDVFDRERRAHYTGGSGTRQLTFTWTVAKGDNDPDGLEFVSLDLNGGTIRDGEGHDLLSETLPAQRFAEHRVRGGLHAMRLEVSGSAREGEPFEIRVIRDGGFEEVAVAGVGVGDSALPHVKPSYYFAENGPGRRQFDFDHRVANEPGVRVSKRTVTPPGDGIADGSRTLTVRLTGTDAGFHLTPPLGDYRAWYLAEGPLEATVPVIDTGLALAEAGLRVSGASAREAPGAKLTFRVTLSPHSEGRVTVDYRTGDDPANTHKAVAGSDYVATSGTLTFEPGETLKTVEVAVLADDHDEQFETMRLFLSNAQGARIDTASGLGVIKNTGPIPKAWIGRFGRTVANQVLDAVESRMRAQRRAGVEMTLAGRRFGSGSGSRGQGPDGDAGAAANLTDWLKGAHDPVRREGPRSRMSREVSQSDLLGGTSFAVTAETGQHRYVSVWGRGAVTRFDGREGNLSLDGEVTSAMIGADLTHDAWAAGLIISHSVGEGGYAGHSEGRVEASLTGLYPWGRLALSERVDAWGTAGYGTGELAVTPKKPETDEDAPTIRTDLDLRMAAAGLRGVLIDGGSDGLTLTGKTDALIVQTASEAARGSDGGNLAAARATVTRLRLGMEGSRPFGLGDGGTLTPSVEIAMRHDGGDAETVFGVDMGGGIAWTLPKHGLRMELRGRGLLTHEAKGFRERGVSGSLAWDPRPSSARGPALTLTQTVGAPASGGADALLARCALEGLGAQSGSGDYGDLRHRRLEAKYGYGLAAWGDRFVSVSEVGIGLSDTGREYILGWRLAGDGSRGPGALQLSTEARRIERSGTRGPAEHRIGARLTARW